MRKLLFILTVTLTVVSCQKAKKEIGNTSTPDTKPVEDINIYIRQTIQQQGQFNWNQAPADILWSALVQSDNILSVGYKPANETGVENKLHTINIQVYNGVDIVGGKMCSQLVGYCFINSRKSEVR